MVLTFSGANVNQTEATNRTLWPLTGGSLSLDLHHPWTYLFVNLGLGTVYPTFNITLTNQLLNETGNGTLCMPQVVLPSSFTPFDGQNASIQVVTVGASGSALYNVSDPSIRYAAPMSSSQPSFCFDPRVQCATVAMILETPARRVAEVGSCFGAVDAAVLAAEVGCSVEAHCA